MNHQKKSLPFPQNSIPLSFPVLILSAGQLAASIIAEGKVQITKKAFSLWDGCEKRAARERAGGRERLREKLKIAQRETFHCSFIFAL